MAWAETLLLNLVLQARFQLTVIACRRVRLCPMHVSKCYPMRNSSTQQ